MEDLTNKFRLVSFSLLVLLFANFSVTVCQAQTAGFSVRIVPDELDGRLSLQAETSSELQQEVTYSLRIRHRDVNRNTTKNQQGGSLKIEKGIHKTNALMTLGLNAESGTVLGYLAMMTMDSVWAFDTLVYNYGKNSSSNREQDGGVFKESSQQEQNWESIGLIIDDTRSRLGADFYQAFNQYWAEPEEHDGYQISISDLPGRGRSFQLFIHLNDRQVVNTFLPQKYDDIVDLAQRAVRLMRYQVTNAQRLQADLDAELTTSTETY